MNNGYATLVANQFFVDESTMCKVFTRKRVIRKFCVSKWNYAHFYSALLCFYMSNKKTSSFDFLKAFDMISTTIQYKYRHIHNVIEFILSSDYYLSNEKFGI